MDTENNDLKEPGQIRVSIIEDHDAERARLIELLEADPIRFQCLSAHANAEDALEWLPSANPDVVLVDIRLPGKSGIEAVQKLAPRLGSSEFMMITAQEDAEAIYQSIKAGATGYLLKREISEKLLCSIEELHQGGSPISPPIARKVLNAFARLAGASQQIAELTTRELQVLQGLARGLYYKEIQSTLGISFATVRKHTNNIYRKLQVHSRTEAVERFNTLNRIGGRLN